MNNDIITTAIELNDFTKTNEKSVVLFGENGCINCSIMESVIEGLRPKYPLISFGFVKSVDLSHQNNIEYYPTLVFYENGMRIGSIVGTGYMMKLRHIFDLWFLKE